MGRTKNEYIMYDKSTDLPVFIGTIEECANYTGLSLSTLKTYMTKEREFEYEIFNMDKLLKDYDEEVM